MKKIAVVGAKGKMGSLILKAIEKEFYVVGIDRNQSLNSFDDIDLVVDFASGSSSVESAKFCLKNKIPLIVGSTGQTKEENLILEEISKQIKIVKKSNFSVGFELMKNFVNGLKNFDFKKVKIIEKHHIEKKDAPSGTALELKQHIFDTLGKVAEIESVREGNEMGEHKIIVDFDGEKIEFKHNVLSRNAFVSGVKNEIEQLIF